MSPSWWPWLTEGLALFTGANLAVQWTLYLAYLNLREEGDRQFAQAHRRGRIDLMHQVAAAQNRLKRALRIQAVSLGASLVVFMVSLNQYVAAHY
jgi:hypothetical protein